MEIASTQKAPQDFLELKIDFRSYLHRGALQDLRYDRVGSEGVSSADRKQRQHVISIHRLRQTQAADVFDVLRQA